MVSSPHWKSLQPKDMPSLVGPFESNISQWPKPSIQEKCECFISQNLFSLNMQKCLQATPTIERQHNINTRQQQYKEWQKNDTKMLHNMKNYLFLVQSFFACAAFFVFCLFPFSTEPAHHLVALTIESRYISETKVST